MISLQSANAKKCTPNLLPARPNHNGPINDIHRHWKPETDEKGTPHAYFRGRHLQGTTLTLPSTHTGAFVHITDKTLPHAQRPTQSQGPYDEEDDDDDVDELPSVDVKIGEVVGEFDEVIVWGHGGQVEAEQDMFIRGMQEWMRFADSIHREEDEEVVAEKKKAS